MVFDEEFQFPYILVSAITLFDSFFPQFCAVPCFFSIFDLRFSYDNVLIVVLFSFQCSSSMSFVHFSAI